MRRCPLWASVRLCGGVLWRWYTLYRVRGKNRSTVRIRAFYGVRLFPAVLCLWFICRCGRLCGSLWAFLGCGRVPVWVKACGGCMGLVWRSVGYALCAPLCGVLRAFYAWGVFLTLCRFSWLCGRLWSCGGMTQESPGASGTGAREKPPAWAAVRLFIYSFSVIRQRWQTEKSELQVKSYFHPLKSQ